MATNDKHRPTSLVGQRVGVYFWTDKKGRDHTLDVRRTEYGVEIEQTIEYGAPTAYDSNRNHRKITIPADPELLKRIARVLLNIVVYEKRAINHE